MKNKSQSSRDARCVTARAMLHAHHPANLWGQGGHHMARWYRVRLGTERLLAGITGQGPW